MFCAQFSISSVFLFPISLSLYTVSLSFSSLCFQSLCLLFQSHFFFQSLFTFQSHFFLFQSLSLFFQSFSSLSFSCLSFLFQSLSSLFQCLSLFPVYLSFSSLSLLVQSLFPILALSLKIHDTYLICRTMQSEFPKREPIRHANFYCLESTKCLCYALTESEGKKTHFKVSFSPHTHTPKMRGGGGQFYHIQTFRLKM